ncbi:10298_t:CDS:2 [Funneliformis caledonium]|uniref:10298_t:CDS:1 n=1 Tax=Funneliformis caledonium TaxID=1117310 RepID=A0A9N8Z6F6_9GLOM|nr:10298_t:CDS:2 [Funneliformis caledonium]
MANLNPPAYGGGITGLVGMPNNSRVLAPMHHLAMGQTPPPSLNPAMTTFGLGFPTMVAANHMNNQRQMQMSMSQTPSPPIPRNSVYLQRPNGINGRGILRVLLFSEYLNCENAQKNKDISHWKLMVSNFFSEDGVIIYGLWDRLSGANRVFEIPNPVISRFFQVNYESGVTSIQLTLNNLKESLGPPINSYATNITVDAKASMIYNYEDGSRVVASGKLKVRLSSNLSNSLSIDCFEFITEKHMEFVPRHQPTSPDSPISSLALHELIEKCISSNKGPRQTLYALTNPEQQSQTIINPPNHTPPTPGPSPPEPTAKTPKEKNDNTNTENIQQQSNNTDVPTPSPSTSNTNIKTDSPTSKSVKSPLLNNKRPGETTPKPKKKRTLQRKNSRQEPGL